MKPAWSSASLTETSPPFSIYHRSATLILQYFHSTRGGAGGGDRGRRGGFSRGCRRCRSGYRGFFRLSRFFDFGGRVGLILGARFFYLRGRIRLFLLGWGDGFPFEHFPGQRLLGDGRGCWQAPSLGPLPAGGRWRGRLSRDSCIVPPPCKKGSGHNRTRPSGKWGRPARPSGKNPWPH